MNRLEEMNNKLYRKLETEYTNFIENLKTLSPDEIISKSYEKVFKEDILLCFDERELSFKEAKALFSLEKPLDSMYHDWLEVDTSYMDELRDSTHDSIKKAVEFMNEKSKGMER